MSNFRKPNGDDYPDASGKHLADAKVLLNAGRADGAAYHSGYVVECALKSLLQLEGSPAWGHKLSELSQLVSRVCFVAKAASARYVTDAVRLLPKAGIAKWKATMRYRSPFMDVADSKEWVGEAEAIYRDTVARMMLDGVIQ